MKNRFYWVGSVVALWLGTLWVPLNASANLTASIDILNISTNKYNKIKLTKCKFWNDSNLLTPIETTFDSSTFPQNYVLKYNEKYQTIKFGNKTVRSGAGVKCAFHYGKDLKHDGELHILAPGTVDASATGDCNATLNLTDSSNNIGTVLLVCTID